MPNVSCRGSYTLGVISVLVGCLAGCGERASGNQSPVGAWEVADPEGAAQARIRDMQKHDDGKGWPIPLTQYLDIFRSTLSSLVLEFKADGTVLQSDAGPWESATWKQTGDQVVVSVERYGDIRIPMGIEYQLRGETLVETGIIYDNQPGKPQGPQSSGHPEVVLRRSSRFARPR